MKNDIISNFKDRLPYLEYIGPVLVFFSFIRLIFYYSYFGVNILNYMEISEVLLSFYNVIITFVLTYSIIGFFFVLIPWFNFHSDNKNNNAVNKRKWNFGWLVFILCTLPIIVITSTDLSIVWKILSWILFILVLLLIINIKGFRDIVKDDLRLAITYIFILIVLFIIMFKAYSIQQAQAVRIDKSTKGTMIIINKTDTLISDDTNYYIGQTKNYIFFYHENERKTEIIPKKEVSHLSVINRNNYLKSPYFFPVTMF